MGTTVMFTTTASKVSPADNIEAIANKGEPWTAILDGAIAGASLIEVIGSEKNLRNPPSFEYAEAPTATPPTVGFTGHPLHGGESQVIANLGGGQSIFARSIDAPGGDLIVTSGA